MLVLTAWLWLAGCGWQETFVRPVVDKTPRYTGEARPPASPEAQLVGTWTLDDVERPPAATLRHGLDGAPVDAGDADADLAAQWLAAHPDDPVTQEVRRALDAAAATTMTVRAGTLTVSRGAQSWQSDWRLVRTGDDGSAQIEVSNEAMQLSAVVTWHDADHVTLTPNGHPEQATGWRRAPPDAAAP
ncbi:MAG: hypothetical protein H6733_00730 [Alphaproteobacteria bacterium]|nr:hypothetical protein [Alphaproteobacteria bacterium]